MFVFALEVNVSSPIFIFLFVLDYSVRNNNTIFTPCLGVGKGSPQLGSGFVCYGSLGTRNKPVAFVQLSLMKVSSSFLIGFSSLSSPVLCLFCASLVCL